MVFSRRGSPGTDGPFPSFCAQYGPSPDSTQRDPAFIALPQIIGKRPLCHRFLNQFFHSSDDGPHVLPDVGSEAPFGNFSPLVVSHSDAIPIDRRESSPYDIVRVILCLDAPVGLGELSHRHLVSSTESIAKDSLGELNTIQRQAKDFERSQAANLVIKHDKGRDPQFLEFTVQNLGQTVASDINFEAGQVELPLVESGWFGVPVVDAAQLFKRISPSRVGYSLGPHDSRIQGVGLMTSTRFLKGRAALAIYAQVSYKDAFDKEHHTSDCITYVKGQTEIAHGLTFDYFGPCKTVTPKSATK